MARETTPPNKEETPINLTVQNIYIKDVSFKVPHSPRIFLEAWKPKVDLNFQLNSQVLSEKDHVYEVVLQVTMTVKTGEVGSEKDVFIAELQQAGAFTIKGASSDEVLNRILFINCPALLFPYLREIASNLAMHAGFPQVTLPTILSFDTIYAAQEKAKKEKQ